MRARNTLGIHIIIYKSCGDREGPKSVLISIKVTDGFGCSFCARSFRVIRIIFCYDRFQIICFFVYNDFLVGWIRVI